MLGRSLFLGLVLVTASLAGCAAPESPAPGDDVPTQTGNGGSDGTIVPEEVQGGQGQGGGAVKNSAPTIEAFSADATAGENDGGFTVTFTATVFDSNTESDLVALTLSATGADAITKTHTLTNTDRQSTSEPASFGGDGFKVWSGDSFPDGRIAVQVQHTFVQFAPSGDYAFVLSATDRRGATAASTTVNITISAFSLIEVSATPVLGDGSPDTGAGWGNWSAEAAGSNVAGSNYIKLVNTGAVPDSTVAVDFTESGFVGTNDTSFSIPIDGNLQFAWFEDTTPGTTAPNEGTYTYGTTSSSGSVTVSFTGQDNVIYVVYRVVDMPAVLPVQSYTASYTVTEL